MPPASPFDAKEQVKQAVDIVDLVGSQLELRRQGRNFVALCPWHDDSHPSLQINPERQSWKCWVCDIGGDIFSFVMRREGVEFREALEMLADRAGIEIASVPHGRSKTGGPNDKKTLYEAVAWAEAQYHDCLRHSPQAEAARRYLDGRGIDQASISRFRLGYAPEPWQWLLDRARTTKFSPPILHAVGLAVRVESSGRFRDFFGGRFGSRIIFPVRDVQDRPVAFGGRILPEVAARLEREGEQRISKYLNLGDTRIFSKSEHLYGLNLAKSTAAKTRQLTVVEGYTDVVIPHQHGVLDMVATLGTALNERHLRLLKRYADSVILVFDGDEAGQNSTRRALKHFVSAECDLRILTLPDQMDPCDFVIQQGAASFSKLTKTAVDALDYQVRAATAGIDLARDTHRATQALEEILGTLAQMPRMSARRTEASPLREQQILVRLAREFRISELDLRTRLNELRKKGSVRRRVTSPARETNRHSVAEIAAGEQELFEILLRQSDLVPLALERIGIADMSSVSSRVLLSTYIELESAGEPLDFNRVLTEVDDPALKNILVELDERAHAKAEHAIQDAAARLNGLIRDFDRMRMAHESQQKERALEEGALDDRQEEQTLEEIVAIERERQGISAPTDG